MKKVVQHLRHKNDINGNPRRLYVVTAVNNGALIAVYEEGYTGIPEDVLGAGYYTIGPLDITGPQYKALKKNAKDRGLYHRG